MRKNYFLVFFATLFVFLFASCNDVFNEDSASVEYGDIIMHIPSETETADEKKSELSNSSKNANLKVYSYKISLKHSSGVISVLEGEVQEKVSVKFSGALCGNYEITAQLFDKKGNLCYECFGSALVKNEKVSEITLVQKKVLKVLSYSAEFEKIMNNFLKTHPDFPYTIQTTIFDKSFELYEKNLENELLKPSAFSPDIFVTDISFVKKYTRGAMSQYLLPYQELGINVAAKLKEGEITKYSVDFGSDKAGEVLGLCYNSTEGAFIYKRSVAEKAFGVSEPSEVAAKIGAKTGNWDLFKKAADICADNNVSIVSGYSDIWNAIANSSESGWNGQGKSLIVDSMREDFIETAKELKDKGWSNGTEINSEEWINDISGNGVRPVLGFFGSLDYANTLIADNCGSSFGEWALCPAPVDFISGGSWVCVNNNLSENKKDSVKELIEWLTLDTSEDGLLYNWACGNVSKGYKKTVPSKKVMKTISSKDLFFGGQNVYEVFYDSADINIEKFSEHDREINALWLEEVKAYVNDKKDYDVALNDFMKNVHNQLGLSVTLIENKNNAQKDLVKASTCVDGVKFEVILPAGYDTENSALWITETDSGMSFFPDEAVLKKIKDEEAFNPSVSARKLYLYYPQTEKGIVYKFELNYINNGKKTIIPVYASAGGGKTYIKWDSCYSDPDNLMIELEKPYAEGMPKDKRMGIIKLKKSLSGYFNLGKEISDIQLEYAVSLSKASEYAVFDGYISKPNYVAYNKFNELINGKTFEYNEIPSSENPYYFGSVALKFKIKGFDKQFFRIAPLNSEIYDYNED